MAENEAGTVEGISFYKVVRYERMDGRETELWVGTDLKKGLELHKDALLNPCRGCCVGEEITTMRKQKADGTWEIHSIRDMIEAEGVSPLVAEGILILAAA